VPRPSISPEDSDALACLGAPEYLLDGHRLQRRAVGRTLYCDHFPVASDEVGSWASGRGGGTDRPNPVPARVRRRTADRVGRRLLAG
jgi:hypothetical protein